jgi:hypothetical protein
MVVLERLVSDADPRVPRHFSSGARQQVSIKDRIGSIE